MCPPFLCCTTNMQSRSRCFASRRAAGVDDCPTYTSTGDMCPTELGHEHGQQQAAHATTSRRMNSSAVSVRGDHTGQSLAIVKVCTQEAAGAETEMLVRQHQKQLRNQVYSTLQGKRCFHVKAIH